MKHVCTMMRQTSCTHGRLGAWGPNTSAHMQAMLASCMPCSVRHATPTFADKVKAVTWDERERGARRCNGAGRPAWVGCLRTGCRRAARQSSSARLSGPAAWTCLQGLGDVAGARHRCMCICSAAYRTTQGPVSNTETPTCLLPPSFALSRAAGQQQELMRLQTKVWEHNATNTFISSV